MRACARCGAGNPESARFCSSCGAALTTPAEEVRKTVTVLFCDLVGSTALADRLDPELLRRVLTRYFEEMRMVLERHGGVVEKFIGDAVMAVFGIPQLHEDDALRALRAAQEMRAHVDELNRELERERGVIIGVRIGVNTGEVVAGDAAAGQALVTGDAVNVAARLEQVAPPGGILVGDSTRRLVGGVAAVEDAGRLNLKGKGETAAWLLLGLHEDAHPGEERSRLVGRRRELERMREAYARASAEGRCRLAVVVGPAGIGKSRLARHFLARVQDEATVLRGRCLSYGEGITFWPAVEIVHQAAGIVPSDGPVEARQKVAGLVAADDSGTAIVEGISALLGLPGAVTRADELFWSFRKLLEALARRRRLVVVLDDVHWAEPTLLDLVRHVGDSLRGPALIVCLAREELLEDRLSWALEATGVDWVTLAPLDEGETAELVAGSPTWAGLDPEARSRIVAGAAGNPLFLEQMLALAEEEADGEEGLPVPATIMALLGARLERLPAEERLLLERASVIGNRFSREALAELSSDLIPSSLSRGLQTLQARDLVCREPGALQGQGDLRFGHPLVRDAAYGRLPKELRADLHERFATWLEHRAGNRLPELEEIVGYHLEQAARWLAQLGPVRGRGASLSKQAAVHLASAGRRASSRADAAAATNLLSRARALLPEDADSWAELSLDLGIAAAETGSLEVADARLGEAREAARRRGDLRVEWKAALEQESLAISLDPGGGVRRARLVAGEALDVFAELGDARGQARAWRLLAQASNMAGRGGDMERALSDALRHAQGAGDPHEEAEIRSWLVGALVIGPSPVAEAILATERHLAWARRTKSHGVEARVNAALGHLLAMSGQFPAARVRVRRAAALAEDLGIAAAVVQAVWTAGEVALLRGDAVEAEARLGATRELLENAGDRGYLSTAAAMQAHALLRLGRDDEAFGLTQLSEQSAGRDDLAPQVLWRTARAVVLARRGEREAVDLAREAVALAADTDFLSMHGDALVALAEVLALSARVRDAVDAIRAALPLYARKGVVPEAERARARLAELERSARGASPSRRGG